MATSQAQRSDRGSGNTTRSAVCIGSFDGVHLGHRALVAKTVTLARAENLSAVTLTFEPHPARYFAPQHAPPLLTTQAQKHQLLRDAGIDSVVVQPFDETLTALSPQAFVEQVLVERLQARHVVVGYDFRFGHRRAGDASLLRELSRGASFTAQVIDAVVVEGDAVSSTRLRRVIGEEGDVGLARRLLGRPYAVEGKISSGAGRGRQIGFPTANLAPENELIPKRGVYAASALLEGGAQRDAVVNIGFAPTLRNTSEQTVEAHLLNFDGNLVGQTVILRFEQRLRDEKRFDSVDQLIAAIERDIQNLQTREQTNRCRCAG